MLKPARTFAPRLLVWKKGSVAWDKGLGIHSRPSSITKWTNSPPSKQIRWVRRFPSFLHHVLALAVNANLVAFTARFSISQSPADPYRP